MTNDLEIWRAIDRAVAQAVQDHDHLVPPLLVTVEGSNAVFLSVTYEASESGPVRADWRKWGDPERLPQYPLALNISNAAKSVAVTVERPASADEYGADEVRKFTDDLGAIKS